MKDNVSEKVFKEQVKRVYDSQLLPTIGSFICAVILAFMQRYVISSKIIISWMAYVLVAYILRWVIAFLYFRKNPDNSEMKLWSNLLLLGIVVVASAWGMASFLLFPSDSLVNQTFLIIVVLGICAGAVTNLSPLWTEIVSFLFLVLIPLITRLFIINNVVHASLGGMILIYLAVLLYISRYNNINIVEVLKLRIKVNQQEKDLKKSEQRYTDFVNNLPIGFFRCSFLKEDTFLMANQALLKTFGYDNNEEFLKVSFGRMSQEISEYKIFRARLVGEGKVFLENIKLKKKDGEVLQCKVTARLIRNREGQSEFFDGIIQVAA